MSDGGSGHETVRTEPHGVTLLQAPALRIPGVVHGFATRAGGVSAGTRAGLNFGVKGGDPPANVAENLRRLEQALGVSPGRLYRQTQVHGRAVQVVRDGDDFQATWDGESDALVTGDRGIALGAVTADCVPVLLADPQGRAVAAVHAGWRGMVGGVIQAAAAAMQREFGCEASSLLAATGPCIGPCCYEVGHEVAEQFAALPGAVVDMGADRRPHLDLPAAADLVLGGLGIAAAHAGACTRCDAEARFYSYRRDAAGTGLQMSVVGLTS